MTDVTYAMIDEMESIYDGLARRAYRRRDRDRRVLRHRAA
jgi:hypothetical protein